MNEAAAQDAVGSASRHHVKRGARTLTQPQELDNTSSNPKWIHVGLTTDSSQQIDRLVRHCLRAKNDKDDALFCQKLSELKAAIRNAAFFTFTQTEHITAYLAAPNGLATVAGGPLGDVFPLYIRGDAQMLQDRWGRGIFEASLLRGVRTIKAKDPITDKKRQSNSTAITGYLYKRAANVLGANGLVNGQWWFNRTVGGFSDCT